MSQASNTARFNKQVKSVLLGMNESKYKVANINDIAPLSILRHNSFNVMSLWGQGFTSTMSIFPGRGDSQETIDGREFYMKGIKINLQLTFAADRLASRVRVWYVQNTTGAPDPTYDTFFRNEANNVMLDMRNNQNWPKTRYLGEIRPKRDYGAGRPQSVYRSYYMPFNKFLQYEGNVASDGSFSTTSIAKLPEKGYLVWVAYDDQGSLGTDNLVTNIEGTLTTYFKDT